MNKTMIPGESNCEELQPENDRDHRCPLCGSRTRYLTVDPETRPHRRLYRRCETCCLVSVPSRFHLTPEMEVQRYEEHENDPSDPGYRTFLSQMAEPMLRRLDRPLKGLDFGSGPGPTLWLMFREKGHSMVNYDLYYDCHPERLESTYDFITTTETVEHLADPARELDRLWSCLRPEGWLGIMTQMIPESEPFSSWHYRNDDTHISFFSRESFEWLAERWGSKAEFESSRVVLFRKPADSEGNGTS